MGEFNKFIINNNIIMMLYLFISCKKYSNRWERIHNMCSELNILNYYIIIGDSNLETKYKFGKNHELIINSRDSYEYLPEKIFKLYSILDDFKYNYYIKLDDDIKLKKKIANIKYPNYCGFKIKHNEGNRKWHFNKVNKNSYYYNKEYTGNYIPYCMGGFGYILSNNAIKLFKQFTKYKMLEEKEIYEDLAVAKYLKLFKIYPILLKNEYIIEDIYSN